ncbi:MAG: hypothetical protein JJU01_05455 [Alkalibacterium sp.]|nr:hypothetical protein [Alkalibacterium sp.]TVP89473.1 MAG: hypothetical protein EA249_09490 [Alkalibacterium sp.]
MFKKIIWPLIVTSASILSILFLYGFIASITVSRGEEEPVSSEDQTEPVQEFTDELPVAEVSDILVMGDSLGAGVGDEENRGFGERYRDLLTEADGEERTLANMSVPGYEAPQLLEQIESGEFDSAIASTELIIISIGGNDLNRLQIEDELTISLEFEETLSTYIGNLEASIEAVRALNPEAQLALIGLYNPYRQENPELSRFLMEWNFETQLLASGDDRITHIPTYELFQYHLDDYLSFDQFHPNGAGYQAIAEALDRILN